MLEAGKLFPHCNISWIQYYSVYQTHLNSEVGTSDNSSFLLNKAKLLTISVARTKWFTAVVTLFYKNKKEWKEYYAGSPTPTNLRSHGKHSFWYLCFMFHFFFQNKTPWSFGLQKYDISESTVFSILTVCSCGNMKKMAVDRPLKSGFIHSQEV